MTATTVLRAGVLVGFVTLVAACTTSGERPATAARPAGDVFSAQVPTWSADDRAFFLHGSMSAEMVPERVLRAFIAVYPDLFPRADLSNFGLIADAAYGWPIGVSRREVAHLGGLPSLGINCASCHVVELTAATGGAPVRVLGAPGHFDVEAFFGALTVATFRTADPNAMLPFLRAYLAAAPGGDGATAQAMLRAAWVREERAIVAAIASDPTGVAGIAPGGLHAIPAADLRLDRARLERGDLVSVVRATLRLMHNVRAGLHIPDQIPSTLPPASGPGRNDAFGLLSLSLFGAPQPYSPVKFGIVWNLADRRWVHWDGNTDSPISRNLLASLGLGAPLTGTRGWVDYAAVKRQTDLSEGIRAPRWPFAVDDAMAARGRGLYHQARCAGCHDGQESDSRLHAAMDVGTDPTRANLFTPQLAQRFNAFLASVEVEGYRSPSSPGVRSTGKYWSPTLAGVWARAPYLHNGSVRTLAELLTPPAERPSAWLRGSRRYDTTALGYTDEGPYRFDTRTPGNSNAGHTFGTDLKPAEKRDLLEFLKTK
ncbi:MAG TPA: hypothetical protein VGM22_13785 [Methylomirabilota bacterium]